MSGICGLVSLGSLPIAPAELDEMIAAAPHRAVDGVDSWRASDAAFARLAHRVTRHDALDEQPLARHGLVLAAAARIDNRDDLVPSLVRLGYLAGSIDTTPDCELILAAHRCWGDLAPARLIGDFAYVLWDRRRRRLVAARDAMGMRPLYYRIESDQRVLFASELKQILAVPGVPCAIDERSIVATIAGPYLPAGSTVYAGIDQLAPGHLLVVEGTSSRTRRYWAPDPGWYAEPDGDDPVGAFRERFARAVADRLDVPGRVGLSLSGGTDSGSIASMAGWLRAKGTADLAPLRTYSWSFRSLPGSDERVVSDQIVEHYGLEATAIPGDDAWPLSEFPEHAPDRDDPYLWVYQPLIERTIRQARDEGVALFLSGDRGDELLGDWVFDELGLLLAGRLRAAVRDLRAGTAEAGGRRPELRILRRAIVTPAIARWAPSLAARLDRRDRPTRPWTAWVPDDVARRVDLGDLIADQTRPPRFDGYARSLRHQRLFQAQSVRLAVLQERTRARFGLASADPFSDRRLVELVLSLRQWQVQRRTRPKQLVREALRGVVPEPIRWRTAKTIPYGLFDRGFRERAVGTVRELLTDSRAAANGWLDVAALGAAYEDYRRTGDAHDDFWWPITVEWWLRRWWT